MQYKLFGNSGLRVSELCLGAMTFGEEWGFGANKQDSFKMMEVFAEKGGNFIDTANMYTNGTSEKYVGEFIKAEREKFVLATKYTLSMNEQDPNAGGNQRKNLIQSLDKSLKRLDTDYIDFYWVHAWDGITPIEETMRALDDVVRSGKVLYVGISDAPAWVVAKANTIAKFRGWTEFTGLQVEYSLIQRDVERDLIPMSKDFNISVAAWGALGGGVLSGKYSKGKVEDSLREGSNQFWGRTNEKNLLIAQKVDEIANKLGKSSSQVSLNWLRQNNKNVIPIIGTRKVSQLEDNLACLDFELSSEDLQQLDTVSQIELGFPHAFLKTDLVKKGLFGNNIIN